MLPDTKYAKSGDVNIAYQVIGESSFDLVLVPGWVSHIEYAWEQRVRLGATFVRQVSPPARFLLSSDNSR